MTPQDLVIRMLPPFAGWLALAALALPGGSPLRGAAVTVFLAAGPGAALIGLCGPALRVRPARGPVERRDPGFARHSDLLERTMLAVFVSIAAVMTVATVLIVVLPVVTLFSVVLFLVVFLVLLVVEAGITILCVTSA